MPNQWVRRHKRDYYHRKAKKEDYRSRASFKLLQAVNRYGFIRNNHVVVDLGAAPGGWLQIARELVGDGGFVLGVDILKISPLGYPNVVTIIGDIKSQETLRLIKALLPHTADVVISDISPNVSGIWEIDQARQIRLAECSLEIARSILQVNGSFFVKAFQGDLFKQFINQMKNSFPVIKVTKPKASRAKSAEVYILGLHYKDKK